MKKYLLKMTMLILALFLMTGCKKETVNEFDRNIARLIQDGVRMAEIIVMDDLTEENSFINYDKEGNVVEAYSIRTVKFPRIQDLDFRPYTKPGGTFDSNIKIYEPIGIDAENNEQISFLPKGVAPLQKGDRFIVFFTTGTIDGQDVMYIEGEGLYRIPVEYEDELNIGRVLLKYYSDATDEQINNIYQAGLPCALPTGEFTNGWYIYFEESNTTVFELLEPNFHASVKGKVKFIAHIKY